MSLRNAVALELFEIIFVTLEMKVVSKFAFVLFLIGAGMARCYVSNQSREFDPTVCFNFNEVNLKALLD